MLGANWYLLFKMMHGLYITPLREYQVCYDFEYIKIGVEL